MKVDNALILSISKNLSVMKVENALILSTCAMQHWYSFYFDPKTNASYLLNMQSIVRYSKPRFAAWTIPLNTDFVNERLLSADLYVRLLAS